MYEIRLGTVIWSSADTNTNNDYFSFGVSLLVCAISGTEPGVLDTMVCTRYGFGGRSLGVTCILKSILCIDIRSPT
jgi:hypothetical protein